MGREFLQGVFSAKAGDVFAAGGQSGIYIAKIDAARPSDPSQTAQIIAAVRARASQAYADDLLGAVQTAAKDSLKVTLNVPLARQTLGVDPNLTSGAPGKAGPAKAK